MELDLLTSSLVKRRPGHGDPNDAFVVDRHRDPIPFVALVCQGLAPEPFAPRNQTRVIEHPVSHEASIRLTPRLDVNPGYRLGVFGTGCPHSSRRAHGGSVSSAVPPDASRVTSQHSVAEYARS